jgi:outer membrane beta-barrel protein
MLTMYSRILALSLFLAASARAQAPDAGEKVEPAKAVSSPDPGLAMKAADESIYVVQRRAYSKSRKFEVTPLFFTSLNNKFVGHFGPGVSLAYHIRENFALEAFTSIPAVPYLKVTGFYSALVDEVYNQELLVPEVVDLKQISYVGGLAAQFSALYGKFEFYGFLIDYDFYVTAGFGGVATKESCAPLGIEGCSKDPDPSTGRGLRTPLAKSDEWKLAGQLGGGMRFFFKDFLGLRLEIRDIAYADKASDAGETTTDTRSNVFFIFGLSVLL